MSPVPVGDRRGRRRLSRQPGPVGVRRGPQGRRHRRGDRGARRDIGVATNNVAEYRGLIAGLELAAEHAPEAEIEVRMDSKLVVEQMAGNWKIKHPSMKPLAIEANRLAPIGTTFTWVPRAENAHADRLANEALDGCATRAGRPRRSSSESAASGPETTRGANRKRGWGPPGGAKPTTLILVRHGVTDHTTGKLLLRRPGQQQPAAERRGPGAGPRDRGVAGPAVGHVRRAGQLPGAAYARDRRDPRRVLRPRDRGGARHRGDGVRHLGRDELHRGAREVSRRDLAPGWATSSPRRTAASRSGPWRSGCSRGATGWWRRTPGRPWSWSAT